MLHRSFSFSLALGLLLPVPTVIVGSLPTPDEVSFKVKPLPNPDRRRRAGGSPRGLCNASPVTPSPVAPPSVPSNQSEADLMPLSPELGVGTTTMSHPTFFWYLPEAVKTVQFTLIDDQGTAPLFEKKFKNPSPGVMQVELPRKLPGLVLGRELRWVVTIVCNPDNPSDNITAEAWIQYAPATPDLASQLQKVSANSPAEKLRQQAQVFQRTGLWYDALQTLMKARAIAPTNPAIQQDLLQLMTEEKLPPIP